MNPPDHDIVCPRCHHDLSAGSDAFVCTSCETRFPICDDGLPILISKKPETSIARGYRWLAEQIAALDKKVQQLGEEEWSPAGWDANRRRLIEAHTHNLAFLRRLELKLRPHVSLTAVIGEAKDNSQSNEYMDFTGHLERDWSGQKEAEAQIRTIEGALRAVLERAGADFDTAVVLGAGMGRYARDFAASFRRVWAFDASVTMALTYRMLRAEPFVYYYVKQKNCETTEEQVRRVELSMHERGDAGIRAAGEPIYVVADANEMPFASASASAVLSIFFTDVIPLPGLLREASRVLRPGGLFAHFGPLVYHFTDARHMLSTEEVRRAFDRAGFDIVAEPDERVTTVHGQQPRGYSSHTYGNWCFVAKKRIESEPWRDRVLRIAAGAVIRTTARVRADGTREITGTVTSPFGDRLDVSRGALDLLAEIDGSRTLANAMIQARARVAAGALDDDEVNKLIDDLRCRGAVVPG